MSNITDVLSSLILPSPNDGQAILSQIKLPEGIAKQITTQTTQILLDIIKTTNGKLQISINVEGEQINISPQGELEIQLAKYEGMTLPAKISNNGVLQIMRPQSSTKPSEIAPKEIVINNKDILKEIEISPLKISNFIDKTLEQMQVAKPIKQQICQDIAKLHIAISDIGKDTPHSQTILQPIKEVLQQIASAKPEQIPILKQELQIKINELVGKQVEGRISERINEITFIKTPIGESSFTSTIKLPISEPLTFNIVKSTPPVPTDIKILEDVIKIIFPKENVQSPDIKSIFQTPALKQVLTTVAESPDIAHLLVQKLPLKPNNIFENMFKFYQAATKQELHLWLGTDKIKDIISHTPKADNIISELNNFITSSVKETPFWRIVEIPFFDGHMFTPIKISVKKDNKDDNTSKRKTKKGTRFIVETQFSKLGNFQFDGFLHQAQRTLDLVIRTSKMIDDDFCSNIINLFKNTLYTLDYAGTIKINRQENFVKTQEVSETNKGIYV